jgi:dolichol-phosphate mannosyltransferase
VGQLQNMKNNFLLSIIIPVYNEEKNIPHIYTKVKQVVDKYNYEVIFVNDGSKDNTFEELRIISKSNLRIKIVSFVRNFGHQIALTAGYRESSGDCVVTIDADLQDPPELIDQMIEKWMDGYDIVYAKRNERNDSIFKKVTAHCFYRLINFLSDTKIPNDVGDYRLLDKKVVEFLNDLPEKSRFLRGLVAWSGYKSTYVMFNRDKRLYGDTHYPLSKMINFALDGIVSFSIKPLKIATFIGVLSSIFGFFGISYALYVRFFLPHDYWVTGWTTLIVGTMFFGGVQLLTIGIIGEYIGRIYKEIQNRPQYLIKERINFK